MVNVKELTEDQLQGLVDAAKQYKAEMYIDEEGFVSLICSSEQDADDILTKIDCRLDPVPMVWPGRKRKYVFATAFDIEQVFDIDIEQEPEIVYVDICSGEVEYVSTDEEAVRAYAYDQLCTARAEALDEWGIDDPTEENIAEADFQAGFDGDCHEIVEVDISNLMEDDIIELPNGGEIEASYILEKLRTCDM